MDAVRAIRNSRQESDVKPSQRIKAIFIADNKHFYNLFAANELYLKTLAGLGELEIMLSGAETLPSDEALTAVSSGATIFLPLAGMIDFAKETARLEKELTRLKAEVKRATGKLNNEKFIGRAPAEIVEEERRKLIDYQNQLQAVSERLERLIKMKS